MKTFSWSLLVCFLAVILLIPAGVNSLIDCHVCNSHYNASCATISKTSTTYLETCPPGENLCRLILQSVNKEEPRTIRECAETGTVGCKRIVSTISDLTGITCHCNTNGCNTAPGMKAGTTVIVTALVTCSVVIIKRLYH